MKRSVAVAVVLMLFTGCGSGNATPAAATVTRAWFQSSTPDAVDGVVYLSVISPIADEIVGVAVPASVARSAELHESISASRDPGMANMPTGGDGTMTMMPIANVDVPPRKVVTMQPGAKHIMLRGLTAPMVKGAVFPLTLTLSHAGPLPVSVTVRDNAP